MKLLIASTAMALVLATPAAFAANGVDAPGANNPGAGSPAAAESSQEAKSPPDTNQSMINVLPAGQIVGREMKDAQGIHAGRIDSLVIDTKSGAVEFVMISPPESFNANGQLIAAPWAAINPPASANGPITTKFNVDKLAKAPRIDPRLIYELNMPEQRDRMYGFYGYNHPGHSGMGYDGGIANSKKDSQNELGARDRQMDLTHQDAVKPPSAAEKAQSAGSSALVVAEDGAIAKLAALTTTSAAAMHDSSVYDRKGKEVGELDETMIDVNRGEVAYVLISHGGFLGMDENLYAAPIQALALSPYRASYRLSVNAQILKGEPALHVEHGNLPSRVGAAQLASLYQRFDIKPYWTAASQLQGQPAQAKD